MNTIKQLVFSLYSLIQCALLVLAGITFRYKAGGREQSCALLQVPEKYDLDETSGFLPAEPLPKLPTAFGTWEEALLQAQSVLSLGVDESPYGQSKRTAGAHWRDDVRTWPILNTDSLDSNIRLLQRAHMVLAYLVHFFVHSQPQAEAGSTVFIPRGLAVPLTMVSKKLGIAPILTFADVVLWNWTVADGDRPLSADSIRHENVFSGKEDERSFYAKCAAIELRAAEALKIINHYCVLPGVDDPHAVSRVTEDIRRIADIIKGLTMVLGTIRDTVDPHTYYHEIRHWWKGSGSDGQGSPLWIYEGVKGGDILDLSGPSAGQSPVMHAIDIFLDVDHKLAERRLPHPSASDKKADRGFMERMRRYMQGRHREYLEYLANLPHHLRIRQVAARHPGPLQDAYNEAVMALKAFRDAHMRVACFYIITMSHAERGMGSSEVPCQTSHGPARGTGGMEVSTLLKATRNATSRAILPNGRDSHQQNR